MTLGRRNLKMQLYSKLGLPSAQIRHENGGAFPKRSSNRKNSLFNVDEEHFENGAFQTKTITSRYNSCDFRFPVFLEHKSVKTDDCFVFRFLRLGVKRGLRNADEI